MKAALLPPFPEATPALAGPNELWCRGKNMAAKRGPAGRDASLGPDHWAVFASGKTFSKWVFAKRGTGTFCAKHPPGLSGKMYLSPFSRKPT